MPHCNPYGDAHQPEIPSRAIIIDDNSLLLFEQSKMFSGRKCRLDKNGPEDEVSLVHSSWLGDDYL